MTGESRSRMWKAYTGTIIAGVALYVVIPEIITDWIYDDRTADCFKDGISDGRTFLNRFLSGALLNPEGLSPHKLSGDEGDQCYRAYNAGYNLGVTQVAAPAALVAFIGFQLLRRDPKVQTA